MSETPAYRDESKLRELYVEKDMTQREIGEKFDVAATTISTWCDKFDIRTGGQGAGSPYDVSMYLGSRGYVRTDCSHKGSRKRFKLHRLIAVAEHGFDKIADNEVHHQNNLRWDNRPSNVEVISPEEHGRLHANERWAKA